MDGVLIYLVLLTVAAIVYGSFLWYACDELLRRVRKLEVTMTVMAGQVPIGLPERLQGLSNDCWNTKGLVELQGKVHADRLQRLERYVNLPGAK